MKCIFLLLTILLTLPCAWANYTLTCPTKGQWSLRSSSRCNETSYYCLLDINTDGNREECLPFPAKDTKGFRKVFAGNVDGIECTSDTYQPFWFWTNGSSECVYKKSLCSEEGQVVQDDGSNEVDRGCRCNYRYGYNYVTKPRDICNCFASEEDCSCYRMSCPRGQLLTTDYECRKITEWKHTFGCPDIHVTISPLDEQSTIILSIVTSKDAEQTASSRVVVRLIALSCLLFIIGLFVLWIFCKQYKQEDLQQNYMEEWQIKDKNFVSTRAASEALQSIRKNQCVIITGPLDCGKTFTEVNFLLDGVALSCEERQKNREIFLGDAMKELKNEELALFANSFKTELTELASINCVDSKYRTPLYHACKVNSLRLVKFFLEHGANPLLENEASKTPLHVSCEKGNIEIIKLLLSTVKRGYSDDYYRNYINNPNTFGNTPLYLACNACHIDIVELLLCNGASLDVQDKDKQTLLHLLSLTRNIDIAKLLLEKKPVLLHMKDNYDMLPVFKACSHGHDKLVQYYIDMGTEINCKNKDGQTPLYIACQEGHIEVVRVLLKASVNGCEADHDMWSPLFVACKYDRQDIVTLLIIGHGAVVNQTTITAGDSPLHQASSSGNETLSVFLIQHGASVNLQN